MPGFENRLIKKPSSKKLSKQSQSKKALKGEELAMYIKNHRDEFKGDGDALCIEAGYGQFGKNGEQKCDFKPFVKELGEVMDLLENSEIDT